MYDISKKPRRDLSAEECRGGGGGMSGEDVACESKRHCCRPALGGRWMRVCVETLIHAEDADGKGN